MATCRSQSAARCLFNVFVRPSLTHQSIHHPAKLPQRLAPTQLRQLHATPPLTAAKGPPRRREQMWNEDIPARRIKLVDSTTNEISVRSLKEVLRELDLKIDRLVCVSAPPGANYDPLKDGEWTPICKIFNKAEQLKLEKQQKEKARLKAAYDQTKMIELNWAIDGNDLQHRLKRMMEFLQDGKRVEIVLAKKKRGREATAEECNNVMKGLRETIKVVKGVREFKPMEGKIGSVAMMYLEGPRPS